MRKMFVSVDDDGNYNIEKWRGNCVKPKEVFIVVQYGGEYEDKYEIMAAAYYSEELAKKAKELYEERDRKNREMCAKLYEIGAYPGYEDIDGFSGYTIRRLKINDGDEEYEEETD